MSAGNKLRTNLCARNRWFRHTINYVFGILGSFAYPLACVVITAIVGAVCTTSIFGTLIALVGALATLVIIVCTFECHNMPPLLNQYSNGEPFFKREIPITARAMKPTTSVKIEKNDRLPIFPIKSISAALPTQM